MAQKPSAALPTMMAGASLWPPSIEMTATASSGSATDGGKSKLAQAMQIEHRMSRVDAVASSERISAAAQYELRVSSAARAMVEPVLSAKIRMVVLGFESAIVSDIANALCIIRMRGACNVMNASAFSRKGFGEATCWIKGGVAANVKIIDCDPAVDEVLK